MKYRSMILAGALTLATATPVLANNYVAPMQQGNISYLSGGVGDAERNALRDEAQGYNLKVINSNPKGAFTADNNVVIESKKGGEVINIDDGGPLVYAKLPPGTYTIKASDGRQNQERTVTVGHGKQTDVHLVWQDQS